MTRDLREGFRLLRRGARLVPLLLAANLALAALLAAPLALVLEGDLASTDAAQRMTDGFDYDWWSEWSGRQTGYARHLGPDILGLGAAARNLDLLLRGEFPGRLFAGLLVPAPPAEGSLAAPRLDPLVLGLGLVSLLVHLYLAGGVLGVFRAAHGRFELRGFLFGAAFYWGRMVRVALLALAAAGLLFALLGPVFRLLEELALEAVSETHALLWSFARHALVLGALGGVHMASSFAKVALVVDERKSAVLAFASGVGFAARHLARAAGAYLALGALGLGLLAAWGALHAAFLPRGFTSLALFLLLAQAVMAARVALRLWLLASQTALYAGGAR